jgi:hemin uptake protein HemP
MVSDPTPTNADLPAPKVAEPPADRQPGVDSPRIINSAALLAGASQLAILHDQTIYFLRRTRFGKLILTK